MRRDNPEQARTSGYRNQLGRWLRLGLALARSLPALLLRPHAPRHAAAAAWHLVHGDVSGAKARLVMAAGLVHADPDAKAIAHMRAAFAMATGDFVTLLDHDDELRPDALFRIACEVDRHPDVQLIYSDEDKINPRGYRCDPYFKPDWNYDLFLSHNLITHLAAYRAARVRDIGGFRSGFEGTQDYDLALRFGTGLTRP